jgi:anhydro-N-acetylmuramic acid kinase
MNVIRAEDLSVSGEALEAIAFVILAYEFLCLRPGNLPSATGARAPAILGKLTLPP